MAGSLTFESTCAKYGMGGMTEMTFGEGVK